MAFELIKQLLNEKIGLAPISIGDSSIERALLHRVVALQLDGYAAYYQRLQNDSAEIRELIDEVSVPETWFFRNRTPFDYLRRYLHEDLLRHRRKDKKIRILSLPCATGEEPYSIAILLDQEKIPAKDVELYAIDISRRAVERAKRGIYGKNALRDIEDPEIIENYFKLTDQGYMIKDSIKRQIKFRTGNILVGSLSPHPGYYDIIFCRNLLIYFDKTHRAITQEKLYRALRKTGLLVVGHAETPHISNEFFIKKTETRSFAFAKRIIDRSMTIQNPQRANSPTSQEDTPPSAPAPASLPGDWQGIMTQLAKSLPAKVDVKVQRQPPDPVPVVTKSKWNLEDPLALAERFITQQRYARAIEICKATMQENGESAQGLYLLAAIKDGQKDFKNAEVMCRKALFLDPKHRRTLEMLVRLSERRADLESARKYKERIKRLMQD